jgi:hypothetical protein
MDQDLQRLTHELRNERCPRRVLDEVTRQIQLQRGPRRLGSLQIATVIVVAALLCAVVIWRRPPAGESPQVGQQAQANTDRAQVAAQAQNALGYLGAVLRDAEARTTTIVLNQAVPPVRNSLLTTKNKLLNPIAQ